MPYPKAGEEKSEYIGRCVKAVMAEGKKQNEALAQCYGMWEANKSKVKKSVIFNNMINSLEKYIAKEEVKEKIQNENKIGILKNIEKTLNEIVDKKQINISKVNKQDTDMINIQEKRITPSNTFFGTLEMPSFLMSPPFNMSNIKPNNVWMKDKENMQAINYKKAMSQWLDLKQQFDAGGLVYVLPSQNDLQDEVYTANLGLVLPLHIAKDTVILSNFRSDPRKHEEDVGRDFFNIMEFNIVQSPHFFEGEADIKYIKENIFCGGYGIRTHIDTYNWLEENYKVKVIKVKMTDARLYHFDTLFFPLNNDNAFVVIDAVSPEDIKQIESVTNIIPIDMAMGYAGSTNCVRIGTSILNGSSISSMEATNEHYESESKRIGYMTKEIVKLGLDPVFVNLSEFEKSGASLSCCLLHLSYFNYYNK